LGELLKGAKVLDLYAGSGNLGLEALSRGAKLATFVEADQDVIEVLKRNILSTGLQDAALVKHTTVEKFLQAAASKFDIILVDPPFKSAKYFPIELLPRVMNPDAAAVLKLPPKTELPDPQQLERVYQQDVGSNVLIYYRK
jgi:16S rRNA (guanine(966)-N(2))-methyltransferase RsmD